MPPSGRIAHSHSASRIRSRHVPYSILSNPKPFSWPRPTTCCHDNTFRSAWRFSPRTEAQEIKQMGKLAIAPHNQPGEHYSAGGPSEKNTSHRGDGLSSQEPLLSSSLPVEEHGTLRRNSNVWKYSSTCSQPKLLRVDGAYMAQAPNGFRTLVPYLLSSTIVLREAEVAVRPVSGLVIEAKSDGVALRDVFAQVTDGTIRQSTRSTSTLRRPLPRRRQDRLSLSTHSLSLRLLPPVNRTVVTSPV